MIVVLVAGIGVIVAGLLAIGFGIPVKEFGFGNTLILTGTIGVCTGLLMLSMVVVLRELKALVADGALAHRPTAPRSRRDLPSSETASEGEEPESPAATDAPLFARDQSDGDRSASDASAPWRDEVKRERARNAVEPAEIQEEAPAPRQRRNLMFSSTRRERERAEAAEAAQADQAAPRTFEDAWPQSEERSRLDTSRRLVRTPSTFSEAAPAAAPEVTVLKSGVVDGMAYSLYSDGSIEAQMPEGMMRFASIDELREHLDQRGS